MVDQHLALILILAGVGLALLWIAWLPKIGFLRASLAALCRAGWLLPVFLAFFPETTAEKLPRTVAVRPVHLLLDDSESTEIFQSQFSSIVDEVKERCEEIGCVVKTTKLSRLADETDDGFTPLSKVIESWIFGLGRDPWFILSDGGDWQPTIAWPESLANVGKVIDGKPRGFVGTPSAIDRANIWIDYVDVAPFSFHEQQISVNVTLSRPDGIDDNERVQLQIRVGDKTLTAVNAEFAKGDSSVVVQVVIPPLSRGHHLLTVQALPTPKEKSLWDNTVHAQVEVLPNTVGALHLLGSPSWDGRFVRRYLKAEPKYDLISFFILRDPWDSQQVNERELSLIPFPVKRLFQEELPNFRVVVIQNFALFQFLEEPYQRSLVDFVKNGGSLLFMGGPRALQSGDIGSSALAEILPFEKPKNLLFQPKRMPFGATFGGRPKSQHGPHYDKDAEFEIELAAPAEDKRVLANVYDDWERIGSEFASLGKISGRHLTEKVKFRENTTPLLNAKTPGGRAPLAVASYPNSGRAIWLFTDQIWRMAMAQPQSLSRQVYHDFLHSAMTWLMREELSKPLVAKSLVISNRLGDKMRWRLTLNGPAARYVDLGQDWDLSVCGQKIRDANTSLERLNSQEVQLRGRLATKLAGGERCVVELKGKHQAFGSLETMLTTVVPKTFSDTAIGGAPQKMRKLSQLTGAGFGYVDRDPNVVLSWLNDTITDSGLALPSRYRSARNFYWMLGRWWFWLLMLLIPAEVLVRRWHLLVGSGRGRRGGFFAAFLNPRRG